MCDLLCQVASNILHIRGSAGWKKLRNTWEYSHVLRAVLAAIALIALIVATAL